MLPCAFAEHGKAREAWGAWGNNSLGTYIQSAKAFDTLEKNLILPSRRLIQYYRNTDKIANGSNPELFIWCRREADKLNLTEEQRYGGLIFDEMTIQENLRFTKFGQCYRITGIVKLGQIYQDYNVPVNGEFC